MTNVNLSGLRVLIVEDEMMVSMLLEDMLADFGCTLVGPATHMEPALQLAQNAEFDVAILDVNLNGDETYPIADALAARAIPFVFSSGYGAGRLREGYRSIPSLQKPFHSQELEQALAAALSQRSEQIHADLRGSRTDARQRRAERHS